MSVRISVESLSGCAWNGCPSQRGIRNQGIDQAIADGLQRFDAGAQGEHKLIRGFEPVITRSWHYLQHPGLRAAVTDFLQQERVGVLAYAEAARQALPYRQAGS